MIYYETFFAPLWAWGDGSNWSTPDRGGSALWMGARLNAADAIALYRKEKARRQPQSQDP